MVRPGIVNPFGDFPTQTPICDRLCTSGRSYRGELKASEALKSAFDLAFALTPVDLHLVL